MTSRILMIAKLLLSRSCQLRALETSVLFSACANRATLPGQKFGFGFNCNSTYQYLFVLRALAFHTRDVVWFKSEGLVVCLQSSRVYIF